MYLDRTFVVIHHCQGGKERGSGVFLAGVYTAICLSDTPALPLFRGQKRVPSAFLYSRIEGFGLAVLHRWASAALPFIAEF